MINMKKRTQQLTFPFLVLIVVSVCFNSCRVQKEANYRELLYLQGKLDTLPNYSYKSIQYPIQKGDLLSIIVYSDNPEATSIYNQVSVGATRSANNTPVTSSAPGYLVNHKGTVYLQGLGEFQVAGKTTDEISRELTVSYEKYLRNPFVDVRVMNRSYTVIGEVQKPGVYPISNESVNVLQAIGAASDITVYGKKYNILIIREQNGVRSFGRLDLNRGDIFQSEYFMLRPNDIVYIEPNNKKTALSDQQTIKTISIIASITSIISAIAILANTFK